MKKLIRIHFIILAVIALNSICRSFFDITFSSYLLYPLKVGLWLTGIILFFYYFKPFKKIAIYFFYYTLLPIVAIIGGSLGGIFSAILLSFLAFPFFENNTVKTVENYKISVPFQG